MEDNTVYFNRMDAVLENAQKTLHEIFGDFEEVDFYGWILADLSRCHEPAVQKKFKGRTVKYIRPKQRIYIQDIGTCKLNDACGIYLDIKWMK